MTLRSGSVSIWNPSKSIGTSPSRRLSSDGKKSDIAELNSLLNSALVTFVVPLVAEKSVSIISGILVGVFGVVCRLAGAVVYWRPDGDVLK